MELGTPLKEYKQKVMEGHTHNSSLLSGGSLACSLSTSPSVKKMLKAFVCKSLYGYMFSFLLTGYLNIAGSYGKFVIKCEKKFAKLWLCVLNLVWNSIAFVCE